MNLFRREQQRDGHSGHPDCAVSLPHLAPRADCTPATGAGSALRDRGAHVFSSNHHSRRLDCRATADDFSGISVPVISSAAESLQAPTADRAEAPFGRVTDVNGYIDYRPGAHRGLLDVDPEELAESYRGEDFAPLDEPSTDEDSGSFLGSRSDDSIGWDDLDLLDGLPSDTERAAIQGDEWMEGLDLTDEELEAVHASHTDEMPYLPCCPVCAASSEDDGEVG